MLLIHQTVYETYPDAKMGLLAMENVDASAPADPSSISAAMETLIAKYSHLDRTSLKALYPIQPYVSYYKKFGYSYHVLGQLESIISGKRTLSAPSALLSAMFQTELESMLLTAGHDLSTLQLPLELKLSSGEEQFTSISSKIVTTVMNDLMVCSGDSIISAILRGPDNSSRITQSTTGVLFTVYAPQGIEETTIKMMLKTLEYKIRSFSPQAKTRALYIV